MGCRVPTSLRYSLLLSVPVWCAFVSSEAMAACAPAAPTSGQTVNCTGASNAFITPVGATGVTVNVDNLATVTGTAAATPSTTQFASVLVRDQGVVNVAGTGAITATVSTTAPARDYFAVDLQGTATSLVNNGAISITNNNLTTGSTARRIYGVISSSNGGPYENVSVVNNGSITVTQNGQGVARGVYAGEDIDSMTVDNYGSIAVAHTAAAAAAPAAVAAVDSDDNVDSFTVTNHAGATMTTNGSSTFTVGGRAQDYTFVNEGTITNLFTTAGDRRAAINMYADSYDDGQTATTDFENRASGTINGNVYIVDRNPFAAAAVPITATAVRDSTVSNAGTINGSIFYGVGTHTLDNSGTISGSIEVNQSRELGTVTAAGGPLPVGTQTSVAVGAGIGGASFELTNTGTLGGDITIYDRTDSVNSIALQGTGFAGNIVAVNGVGSNSLDLKGVTNLASVQNFNEVNLHRSNVAVTNGVSLVSGATLRTTVYGPGGTRAAPSTRLGTINGTLTLAGPTTLVTRYTGQFVRNGDVYQVASAVNGAGANQITVRQRQSALIGRSTVDTSDGRLLLIAKVRDPRTFAGTSQPAGATLNGLLTYNGNNPQVRALGAAVEALPTQAAVRAAGDALSPITNGADVQIPINSVMAFHQQIDSRLDAYIFSQIPSSGRSADLGVARPVPVYGVLPASGGWIEGIGGGVHQSTVNGVQGYNAQLTGVIGGYDRLITPNIRVGGAFGYIDGRVNGNESGGRRENIQTFQGLGYAALEGRNYYLRGSAGYGGVNFASNRQISFPGFNDVAFGTHSGNIFTARGEGGVPLEYLNSLVIPYAAFTYSRLQQNAYTEISGNGAGLSYQSARNNSERSEVGGKVIVPIVNMPVFSYLFPRASVVAVEARAAYVHEFGNVAQTVAASFTGGGAVFVAAGPVPNRDMVDYGVGLRMGSGPVQIDISYNGLARSTYLQQVGLLRARYVF